MILKDKVAIVTGGTSGIGEAIVRRFAMEGARVVFSGRRKIFGEIIERETGAVFFHADITKEEECGQTIFKAASAFGQLDILVNNAGVVSQYDGIDFCQSWMFDDPFKLHVTAAVNHIRYASVAMRARQGGSIINIASTAAHRGHGDGRVPYVVSKAALVALTHALASELRRYNIRINSISPGNLVPGPGGPDPVVDAVMFFALPVSAFVTGTDLLVDDGRTCGYSYMNDRP
jgi:NAD(P)-dependent dehydrogenase (short-subunit alcohol dehydrogenase family)